MNVLQILPELNVGGAERGAVDLAKYLSKKGYKSIVISWGGRLEDKLDFPGIKHYKLPVHKKSPFTILRLIPKIAWIMKNEEVKIIHARSRVPAIIAFFAYRNYVASNPIDKDFLVSFITTCHGYYNTSIFSRVMGFGKLIIVASHVIGRHMNVAFGVPLERIRLVPRGVGIDKFSYREPSLNKTSDFVVGMVARITPLKGHQNFLKAMSKVIRTLPKTKIVIAGNVQKGKEDYKRKLDLLVKLLGLERHVEFVGVVDDVPSFMHDLDLLVSSSTTSQEAFGRVIIEAFSCGVPVLATAVGGATEIITHMKDGILVPVNQPHKMAEEAKRLLKDRRLSLQLSREARRTVEKKYSLKKMMESTIKIYKESDRNFRILIIKLTAVGDIILFLPSIKAIRERFKDATIYVVTSMAGREMLSQSNFVDEVIVCQDRNNDKLSYRYLWNFSGKLRSIIFDVVIDLQNNKKSHLLSYLSGAPKRYGYKSSKLDFFLNHAVSQPEESLNPIAHQAYLLKNLGITNISSDIEIDISNKDQEYVDRLLKQEWVRKNEFLISLNPFASVKWKTKVWPISKYAELIDKLTQNNIRTVITSSKDAKDLVRKICKAARSKPINFAGKTTILQLAALFKRCKVVITPDSAPMHLAVALKVPCIALFGPTEPARHIPKGAYVKVLRKDLHCSPCYKSKCGHTSCMEQISIDEVLQTVVEML